MPTYGIRGEEQEQNDQDQDQVHVVTLSDKIDFEDFAKVLSLACNVDPMMIFYTDEEGDEVPITTTWEFSAAKRATNPTAPLRLRLHKGDVPGKGSDDVYVDLILQSDVERFIATSVPFAPESSSFEDAQPKIHVNSPLSPLVAERSMASGDELFESASRKSAAAPLQTAELEHALETIEGAVGGETVQGVQRMDSKIDSREKKRSWSRRIEDMLNKLVHDVHKIKPKRKVEATHKVPEWFVEAMDKYMDKFKKETSKECARRTMKQLNKSGAIGNPTALNHERNYGLVVENPVANVEVLKLDARFLADFSYPDGTLVKPNQVIAKHWAVMNTGPVPWPDDTKLVYLFGDLNVEEAEISIGGLSPGATKHVLACAYAPIELGRAQAHWAFMTKRQSFGDRLWCSVLVTLDADGVDQATQTNFDHLDSHDDSVDETLPEVTCRAHTPVTLSQPVVTDHLIVSECPAEEEPSAETVEITSQGNGEVYETPSAQTVDITSVERDVGDEVYQSPSLGASEIPSEVRDGSDKLYEATCGEPVEMIISGVRDVSIELYDTPSTDGETTLVAAESERSRNCSRTSSSDSDFVVIPVPRVVNLRAVDSDSDDGKAIELVQGVESLTLNRSETKDSSDSSDFIAIDSELNEEAQPLLPEDAIIREFVECQSAPSCQRRVDVAHDLKLLESTYISAPGTPTSPYRSVSSSPVPAQAPPVSPLSKPCSGEVSPFIALSLSRCSTPRSMDSCASLESLNSQGEFSQAIRADDDDLHEPDVQTSTSSASNGVITICESYTMKVLEKPSSSQPIVEEVYELPSSDQPCAEEVYETPNGNHFTDEVPVSYEPTSERSSSEDEWRVSVGDEASCSEPEPIQDIVADPERQATDQSTARPESAAVTQKDDEGDVPQEENLTELDLLKRLSELHSQVFETIVENDKKLASYRPDSAEVGAAMQALKQAQMQAAAVFEELKQKNKAPQNLNVSAEKQPTDVIGENDVAEDSDVTDKEASQQNDSDNENESSSAPAWHTFPAWQPTPQQWMPTSTPWVPKPSSWTPPTPFQLPTVQWKPVQSNWKPPSQWTPSEHVLQAMIPPPSTATSQCEQSELKTEDKEEVLSQSTSNLSTASVQSQSTDGDSQTTTHTTQWFIPPLPPQVTQIPPRQGSQIPPQAPQMSSTQVPQIPPTQGHQMPSTQGHQMPPAQEHQLPPTQGHQMPSAQGHQMPPTQGPQMPSAQGHQMPSAQGYQMPRTQGYQMSPVQIHQMPVAPAWTPSPLFLQAVQPIGRSSHRIPRGTAVPGWPSYTYPAGYPPAGPMRTPDGSSHVHYPAQAAQSPYPNGYLYPPQTAGTTLRERNLQTLREMGFQDDKRNQQVLQKTHDDLYKTLMILTNSQ